MQNRSSSVLFVYLAKIVAGVDDSNSHHIFSYDALPFLETFYQSDDNTTNASRVKKNNWVHSKKGGMQKVKDIVFELFFAYFGMRKWLNQYVAGKIGLELGLYVITQ